MAREWRAAANCSRHHHVIHVRIDVDRCSGHGRCYSLAPELFEPDELGNGRVLGDCFVAEGLADQDRRAVANGPERAITMDEGTMDDEEG